jgi:hypothetical protein
MIDRTLGRRTSSAVGHRRLEDGCCGVRVRERWVVEDKLTSIGIGGRYMSATAELSQACDWASHVAVELGSHRHNMCL